MKRYAYVDMDKKLIKITKDKGLFRDYIEIKTITYNKNSVLIQGKYSCEISSAETFMNFKDIEKRLLELKKNYYKAYFEFYKYEEDVSNSFFKKEFKTFYKAIFHCTKIHKIKRKFTNFSVVEEITR